MDTTVAIGTAALSLTYSDLLSQRQIICRYVHALDIVRFYWFGSTVNGGKLEVF